MKTPMQELIYWMKAFDNRNLTISRFDLDLKINELLEKEKQMIIDAYNAGIHEAFGANYIETNARQYYNETFEL